MKHKKTRTALVSLGVILVFALLARLSWDFVRDTIAAPTYYLIWTGNRVLNAIPQQVYLGLLILGCIGIGLNTFAGMRANRFADAAEERRSQPDTRYSFWRRHCARLHSSRFSREQFAAETRNLLLSMLAYREGLSAAEVEALIGTDALHVPEPVKYLIEQKEIRAAPIPPDNILRRLRKLIPLFLADPPRDPQIDSQIAEIIRFIEYQLEITDAGNQTEA